MSLITDIKFETLGNGCVVPTNRKLNEDGYFVVTINKKHIRYHKYLWQLLHGELPKDFTLHHLCHNKACCNVEHLIALHRRDHTRLHNWEKYEGKKQSAKVYWLKEKCTGATLGNLFGVNFSTACKWIRQWKKEVASDV